MHRTTDAHILLRTAVLSITRVSDDITAIRSMPGSFIAILALQEPPLSWRRCNHRTAAAQAVLSLHETPHAVVGVDKVFRSLRLVAGEAKVMTVPLGNGRPALAASIASRLLKMSSLRLPRSTVA